MPHSMSVQCVAACYSVLQRVAVRCSVLHCTALLHTDSFFDCFWFGAVFSDQFRFQEVVALCRHSQKSAPVCCSVLQYVVVRCSSTVWDFVALGEHTATHCSTLQHTAIHCNTLQHTAIHSNILQHTATSCNTLQQARSTR